MKVREIMTPNPITLRPDNKVSEASMIFMEKKIDGAPVVDENAILIGLFTKSHILRVINLGMNMETKVEELMTRTILTGHPDDEFDEVVNATVPRLPVIDEDGRVVGIITRGDIAKAFFSSYQSIFQELDTIINSTHNLIVSIDDKGRIKVWNEAAERLLGRTTADVIGKSILDVLPTSDLMDVIATGKSDPLKKVMLNDRYFISNRTPIIK